MTRVQTAQARQDRWSACWYAAVVAGDEARAVRVKRLWLERNRRAVFGLPFGSAALLELAA